LFFQNNDASIPRRADGSSGAKMSGRPGTASGARGGVRPTATPLNPFGLDGGGRSSDIGDARDPLADSLARAESLLGRYAGDGGRTARPGTARPGTARPGTARPGTARPGTARPSTARRGAATGAVSPPSERHAQPEVLVLDSAPDFTNSFADDGETLETSFDDDPTATASFSVDLDENVDDASISFAGAHSGALEPRDDDDDDDDDHGGDGEVSFEDEGLASPSARAAAPRGAAPPRSWGDVASARPRAAVGASRPSSARGGARSALGSTIRRGGSLGGLGGGDAEGGNGGAGAAPWAGALDGSALETVRAYAETDASVSMLYDEDEDFETFDTFETTGNGALEETGAGAIEAASDDDDARDAEIVGDGDESHEDESHENDAVSLSPETHPRGARGGSPKSPAQLDAEADTEALHGRLASLAPPPVAVAVAVAVASPPASPKRASASPRSPRVPVSSVSPAAREAEADTRALHRTLSGNDPTSALKDEIARHKRMSPPPPPPAALPPVSPRGGARRPFAPEQISTRALDAGYESSSADEVATEGEPTPRTTPRAEARTALSRERLAEPVTSQSPISARAASPAREAPRESTAPPSPRAAGLSEDESFLLEAIRAARREGAPLDTRASAMLAGLVSAPAPAQSGENARGAAPRAIPGDVPGDVPRDDPGDGGLASREAARDARRAFEYAATPPLSRESPLAGGPSPHFSPGAAAAEARALARGDARREEAALASSVVGATGRDDWWAFLGGRGAYPGARQEFPTKDANANGGSVVVPGNERAGLPTLFPGDAPPELAWADAMRARSFDGAMRARVASLRVRLRTSVAGAETRRYAAESASRGSRGSGARPTATAR